MRSWLQLSAAFAIFLSFSAAAQQNAPSLPALGQSPGSAPGQPQPTLAPRSHDDRERAYQARQRVILNVRVTDAAGKPAEGLSQSDFSLLDDRRPAKIEAFRQAAGEAVREHVHVLLVLDAVNSTFRGIAVQRKEVEKYLTQNRGKLPYPISLVLVSASGLIIDPPSQDADVLLGELSQLTQAVRVMDCSKRDNPSADDASSGTITPINRSDSFNSLNAIDGAESGGGTAAQVRAADCKIDQFVVSMGALNRLVKAQVDQPGRAIVIWTGPGWPLLSGPGFNPDTSAMRRGRFDQLVNLSAYMQQAQVTLDAVLSPDQSGRAELVSQASVAAAPPAAGEAGPANFTLPILARQTGGRVFESGKDLAGAIAASIADGDSYYVVSFDAAAVPAAEPGEYHPLEIKVDKPGLTVRTNFAYFARP